MKLRGKTPSPPKPVEVPIFREGDSFVFVCGPVMDDTPFDDLVPQPKLVKKLVQGTTDYVPDPTHKESQARMAKYNRQYADWKFLTSLNFTPELEWDSIDMTNPETWRNYEEELRAFLTEGELADVINGVHKANHPTDETRQAALESFAASQEQASKDGDQQSTKDEQSSTTLGGPAKDSESSRQESTEAGTSATGTSVSS